MHPRGGPFAFQEPLPAGFRRDNQFIPVHAKILTKDGAEVLFGRPVWRPIIIRQIKMDDATVEGAQNYGAPNLEYVSAAEVLPQPKRDKRQHQARMSGSPESGSIVSRRIGQIGQRASSFMLANTAMRFSCSLLRPGIGRTSLFDTVV